MNQDKIEIVKIGNQKKIVRIVNEVQKSKARLKRERELFAARQKKKEEKKQGQVRCQGCGRNHSKTEAFQQSRQGFCSRRCQRVGVKTNPTQGQLAATGTKQDRQRRRIEKKKISQSFYESNAWRCLRYTALRKFKFTCLACGRRPPQVILHVDHIKPRSLHPELELHFDNLQVLCEDCNLGKSNRSADDLRPGQWVDSIK